jgi:hypothetical protein
VVTPSKLPFAKYSTLATEPSTSAAVATIVMLAGATNVVPEVGEVMVTVGGVLSCPNATAPVISASAKVRKNLTNGEFENITSTPTQTALEAHCRS